MARVPMRGDTMGYVPSQVVYINGTPDPALYCVSISENPDGITAQFEAPGLLFGMSKQAYYTGEVTVMIDGDPSPAFHGIIESSNSRLSDSSVIFSASCVYSHLRRRSTAVRDYLTLTDEGTRTFSMVSPEKFPEVNEYVKYRRQSQNWTPFSVLDYFVNSFMDPWFKERIQFVVDPSVNTSRTYSVPVFKWVLDSSTNKPILTAELHHKSELGNQVFRLPTWGELIDFLCRCMPGVQPVQAFSRGGLCVILLTGPYKAGWIAPSIGYNNEDWILSGANVQEVELETRTGDSVNRYVGLGAPAQCTITVMSEMEDENGNLIGLIPDWPIYSSDVVPPGEFPLVGASAYDYDSNSYPKTSILQTSIYKVLKTPEIADPASGSYLKYYDKVGRSYRLPNWFTHMDIVTNNDMFSEPNKGSGVSVQLFVEEAVLQENKYWLYEWVPYDGRVSFDWDKKSFVMETVCTTWYLKQLPMAVGYFTVNYEAGLKLCRVALTFTYSSVNYVPYADTYMMTKGVIDRDRSTAIKSGQPIVFERPDFVFSQFTNIGMPLYAKYAEKVGVTVDEVDGIADIYQVPLEEPIMITYRSLVVAAYADDHVGRLVRDVSRSSTVKPDGGLLISAVVTRDDTPLLHQTVRDLYMWSGRRIRSFRVKLMSFYKSVRRGMLVSIQNAGADGNDMDVINSVYHNLVTGETSLTTSNQFGNSLDLLTIKRDMSVDD